ncbi:hypothetical protein VTJ83DRAFT_3891 [Remersonia thermophila]|uniref:RRM domain-containing protein n=1 Tax=Remersonia thermophila TaxID=72144 RepID=A0ABR4DFB8_9PEZI
MVQEVTMEAAKEPIKEAPLPAKSAIAWQFGMAANRKRMPQPNMVFYWRMPADAPCVLSLHGSVTAPRTYSRLDVPPRRHFAWHDDHLRATSTILRRLHGDKTRSMVRPRIWEDLYRYFDAVDLWTRGAWNLWRLIHLMCDENAASPPPFHLDPDYTYEVMSWAYAWCTDPENRSKLRAWNRKSDILTLMSAKDRENLAGSPVQALAILRFELSKRYDEVKEKDSSPVDFLGKDTGNDEGYIGPDVQLPPPIRTLDDHGIPDNLEPVFALAGLPLQGLHGCARRRHSTSLPTDPSLVTKAEAAEEPFVYKANPAIIIVNGTNYNANSRFKFSLEQYMAEKRAGGKRQQADNNTAWKKHQPPRPGPAHVIPISRSFVPGAPGVYGPGPSRLPPLPYQTSGMSATAMPFRPHAAHRQNMLHTAPAGPPFKPNTPSRRAADQAWTYQNHRPRYPCRNSHINPGIPRGPYELCYCDRCERQTRSVHISRITLFVSTTEAEKILVDYFSQWGYVQSCEVKRSNNRYHNALIRFASTEAPPAAIRGVIRNSKRAQHPLLPPVIGKWELGPDLQQLCKSRWPGGGGARYFLPPAVNPPTVNRHAFSACPGVPPPVPTPAQGPQAAPAFTESAAAAPAAVHDGVRNDSATGNDARPLESPAQTKPPADESIFNGACKVSSSITGSPEAGATIRVRLPTVTLAAQVQLPVHSSIPIHSPVRRITFGDFVAQEHESPAATPVVQPIDKKPANIVAHPPVIVKPAVSPGHASSDAAANGGEQRATPPQNASDGYAPDAGTAAHVDSDESRTPPEQDAFSWQLDQIASRRISGDVRLEPEFHGTVIRRRPRPQHGRVPWAGGERRDSNDSHGSHGSRSSNGASASNLGSGAWQPARGGWFSFPSQGQHGKGAEGPGQWFPPHGLPTSQQQPWDRFLPAHGWNGYRVSVPMGPFPGHRVSPPEFPPGHGLPGGTVQPPSGGERCRMRKADKGRNGNKGGSRPATSIAQAEPIIVNNGAGYNSDPRPEAAAPQLAAPADDGVTAAPGTPATTSSVTIGRESMSWDDLYNSSPPRNRKDRDETLKQAAAEPRHRGRPAGVVLDGKTGSHDRRQEQDDGKDGLGQDAHPKHRRGNKKHKKGKAPEHAPTAPAPKSAPPYETAPAPVSASASSDRAVT